jgi:hypothetical protein
VTGPTVETTITTTVDAPPAAPVAAPANALDRRRAAPRNRRASDAPRPWYRIAFEFLLAPFVESYHGLSLTRLVAILWAVIIAHAIEATHHIGAGEISFAIIVAAMIYGKKVFVPLATAVVQRVTLVAASVQQRIEQKIDSTSRVITERRDPERGFEPSP